VAATVAHAGLWKIGQLRPVGDSVRFREVTIDEAWSSIAASTSA
jgi:allophanate hydrolase subunit 2